MRRRTRLAGLCAAAGITLAAPFVHGADAAHVLVLQGGTTPRITQTLAVLQQRVRAGVEVIKLSSARDEALEEAIARGARDTVIVALGPHASDYMMTISAPVPVVHCLASADAVRAGLPSVPTEVPGEHQARWLRKLLPAARTIGILYNPERNTLRAQTMASALSAAGFGMVLQPVSTPAALPAALDSIAGRVDALLALRDATVYTRETSRGILLFLLRRSIPLIGPDDAWVRNGALYALDWDYEAVGHACAAHVARAMSRTKSGPPSPRMPGIRVSVNRKVAAGLGLDWSAEILRDVDIRHE